MAKKGSKRRASDADRAFRKAWKLLGRLEGRLERARSDEAKRVRQLGDGTEVGNGVVADGAPPDVVPFFWVKSPLSIAPPQAEAATNATNRIKPETVNVAR